MLLYRCFFHVQVFQFYRCTFRTRLRSAVLPLCLPCTSAQFYHFIFRIQVFQLYSCTFVHECAALPLYLPYTIAQRSLTAVSSMYKCAILPLYLSYTSFPVVQLYLRTRVRSFSAVPSVRDCAAQFYLCVFRANSRSFTETLTSLVVSKTEITVLADRPVNLRTSS